MVRAVMVLVMAASPQGLLFAFPSAGVSETGTPGKFCGARVMARKEEKKHLSRRQYKLLSRSLLRVGGGRILMQNMTPLLAYASRALQ